MMKDSIWKRLKKPFFVLAPMENVTDTVFRRVVARIGRPDLFFTEFTSTAGLCSKGVERVKRYLQFTEEERPIIAQIWGIDPKNYYTSAKMIADMGFDGIDINMGCPDRKIIAKGSCSGLIRNPKLAAEIIQATKEGAGGLPVSVKTRIGFAAIATTEWIGFLLEQDLAAITVHGRSARDMSKVPAHWDEIGRVAKLRDEMKKETLIVGNGDVLSRMEGLEKCREYGVDGIMVGRGIFHDLWLFAGIDPSAISQQEKLRLLREHILLFKETWGDNKPYEMMKKFYKVYVSGEENSHALRSELFELRSVDETLEKLNAQIDD